MLIIKYNPLTKPLLIDQVLKKISTDFDVQCCAKSSSDIHPNAINISVSSPINLFKMIEIEKIIKGLYL